MRPEVLPLVLLDLVVIVVLARASGALARRLGQPPVVGEILGGVLLGPTLFGGAITRFLFPAAVLPVLSTLANVGVCVLMLLIGSHLETGPLRGRAGSTVAVSLGSFVLPFGLGALLGWGMLAGRPTAQPAAFVLFLGTATAVTALPVLARILADRGMLDTPVGVLALACAAVNDVLAWVLLAAVGVLAAAGGGATWRLALVVPFVLVMLTVVRPRLARLAARPRAGSPVATAVAVVAVAAGLALCSAATDWMGLHLIFGAFLFGTVLPRRAGGVLRERVESAVQRLNGALLLPVFFVVAGVGIDLARIDGAAVGLLGLILLGASIGKFGGTYLAARAVRVDRRAAAVLATLLNTRGLTELIVLTVGLHLGVLDRGLYSLLVVMALLTTATTGVVLRFVRTGPEAAPGRGRHAGVSPRAGTGGIRPAVLRSGSADGARPGRHPTGPGFGTRETQMNSSAATQAGERPPA